MKKLLISAFLITGLYASHSTDSVDAAATAGSPHSTPLSGSGAFGSTSDLPVATSEREFKAAVANAKKTGEDVTETTGESRFFRAYQDTKALSIKLKKARETLADLKKQENPCEPIKIMIREHETEIANLEELLSTKKRIFNVCGGGAKGLVPALLAAILEEYINLQETQDASSDGSDSETPKKWKYLKEIFDVFSGTSTGSIVAAGLAFNDGTTQYEAYKIAQIYFRHLPEVFTANSAFLGGGTIKCKYQPDNLDALLLLYFKNKSFADAFKQNTCYVMATKDTNSRLTPYVFGHDTDAGTSMAGTSCRASGAAPTFFPKAPIGTSGFVDGGVLANDASETSTHLVQERCKGFIEVFDFGCGVEAPTESSSVDVLAGITILQNAITGTQNASRERLFKIAKSEDRQVTYLSLIEPLLNPGMGLDSTSDLFIHDCFLIAQNATYSAPFLSMICQISGDIKKDKLQMAVHIAFQKIRSIEYATLTAMATQSRLKPETEEALKFFGLYACRQLQCYKRPYFTGNGLEIMENGVLRPIRTDEFHQTLLPFLEKLNPAKTALIKALRDTTQAPEYTQEQFTQLMKEAHQYRYANSTISLIPAFQDRPTGDFGRRFVNATCAAASSLSSTPRAVLNAISYPKTTASAASKRLKKAANSRTKRLTETCTDMTTKLDNFDKFLLAYYNTLDALKIETHDHQDIEWVTEAILNKMFKVEFYSLADIHNLIHACQIVADDTNPYSVTRLDSLIIVLQKKISAYEPTPETAEPAAAGTSSH